MKKIWLVAAAAIVLAWVGILLTARATLRVQAEERSAFALMKLQDRARFLPESPLALSPTEARELLEDGQWIAVLQGSAGETPRFVPVEGSVPQLKDAGALRSVLGNTRLYEGALESDGFDGGPIWIGFAKRSEHYWLVGQGAAYAVPAWLEWANPLGAIASSLAGFVVLIAAAFHFFAWKRARAGV